jgi:hypothetical protein
MTIQAPPSRASADKRSSEKAGMNSAFCLSRAMLMAVPGASRELLKVITLISTDRKTMQGIPLNLNLEKWDWPLDIFNVPALALAAHCD